MKKPFLLLQFRPEDVASDGELDSFTRLGGIKIEEVERVRMEKGEIPKRNIHQYAGILAGGGPFNISTPTEKKDTIERRAEQNFMELLRMIISQDIPFLGACYGLGALAKVLGGVVSKNDFAEPAGAVDIVITDEGKEDTLFSKLPSPFRAFVGHKEACESVPLKSVLLATSAICPVQAIRVGKFVYATQFHPELDPSGICVRIDAYRHHGYFKPEEAESLKSACLQENITVPLEILRRFVEIARMKS